jgi:hypothetical protein
MTQIGVDRHALYEPYLIPEQCSTVCTADRSIGVQKPVMVRGGGGTMSIRFFNPIFFIIAKSTHAEMARQIQYLMAEVLSIIMR